MGKKSAQHTAVKGIGRLEINIVYTGYHPLKRVLHNKQETLMCLWKRAEDMQNHVSTNKAGCVSRPMFPVPSTRKVSGIAYNKKKFKLKQLISILSPCVYRTFLCGHSSAHSVVTPLRQRKPGFCLMKCTGLAHTGTAMVPFSQKPESVWGIYPEKITQAMFKEACTSVVTVAKSKQKQSKCLIRWKWVNKLCVGNTRLQFPCSCISLEPWEVLELYKQEKHIR